MGNVLRLAAQMNWENNFGAPRLDTICAPGASGCVYIDYTASSQSQVSDVSEAFFSNARTRLLSITVAATENTTVSLGPLATYSNFGEPFEIAAPGERWVRDTALLAPGVLCGLDDTASCRTGGTSAAAPTVAGVAALIASGNLTSFGVPNAPVLKAILLNNHTVVDPAGLSLIPGNRGLTMLNLP